MDRKEKYLNVFFINVLSDLGLVIMEEGKESVYMIVVFDMRFEKVVVVDVIIFFVFEVDRCDKNEEVRF